MNDRLLLRLSCGTALISLFVLGGAAAAEAQTTPRRIPPRILTPAPPPPGETAPAAEGRG